MKEHIKNSTSKVFYYTYQFLKSIILSMHRYSLKYHSYYGSASTKTLEEFFKISNVSYIKCEHSSLKYMYCKWIPTTNLLHYFLIYFRNDSQLIYGIKMYKAGTPIKIDVTCI